MNVSDVLSMGALPLYFLVTIGVSPQITSPDIERLYKGMRDASKQLNIIQDLLIIGFHLEIFIHDSINRKKQLKHTAVQLNWTQTIMNPG